MLNKKNMLLKYRQRKIMKAFAVDSTATQTAHFLDLDRKTVNRYYSLFRVASLHVAVHRRAPWHATRDVDILVRI